MSQKYPKNIANFLFVHFFFIFNHLSWLNKGKTDNFSMELMSLLLIKVRPHTQQHHESLMSEGPHLLLLYVGVHEVEITSWELIVKTMNLHNFKKYLQVRAEGRR